jgi:hypothetical protein
MASSPLLACAFFVLATLAYWILGIDQGGSQIAKSQEWVTWKVLASVAIAIAAASAVLGVSAVRKATNDGGVQNPPQPQAAERLAAPLRQKPSGQQHSGQRAKLGWYSAAAVVLIAATFLFLVFGVPKTEKWPASLHITPRTLGVAITIGLAAIPWLVLVWLLQDRLKAYAKQADPASTRELRHLWDSLYAIVLAFAVFVVLALVPTGGLRVAYFAGPKDPAADKQGAEFPASDVLLYGAFFAVLLSAIALPMVAAHRTAARRRLDASLSDPPKKDDKDAVEWQETLLHLDIGVLRSPITALTVFTPLITAALAAYLPDLAT